MKTFRGTILAALCLPMLSCATQVDETQYQSLAQEPVYGESNGWFYDNTTAGFALFADGTEIMRYDSSGNPSGLVPSEAQGDTLVRGSSTWERLAIGTANQVYVTNAGATAPNWVTISGDATNVQGALTVSDVTVGSDAAGDILYKSSATALARLGIGAAGALAMVNAGATAPSWLALGTAGELLKVNPGATAPEWVTPGELAREFVEDFEATATTTQVANIQPDGTAFDGTADVLNHVYSPDGNVYGVEALGAGQTLEPAIVAGGLDIGGDAADDEGYEMYSHFLGATGKPFIAQVDAAFYFTAAVLIGDVSDTDDLQIGFRRAEIARPNFDDYLDAAAIGIITSADPALIQTQTILNDGATGETSTTDTLADATVAQFKILVSAAGVVTFQHDLATPGTLAAPSAAGAFTFDAGDPVIPFVRFINAGANDTDLVIDSWDVGYQ